MNISLPKFLFQKERNTQNTEVVFGITGVARRVYVCQKLRYRFVYWTDINTGLGFCLTLRYKN